MKINIVNIGCFKNLVDCEQLLKQLEYAGHDAKINAKNSRSDVVIINTCGFIGDAQEDSRKAILEYIEKKNGGELDKLIVMGCYSERFREKLGVEMPEVDHFYGNFDWHNILKTLGSEYCFSLRNERVLTTPSHYAYIKISEGCNQKCAYCTKPIINGKHVSRSMEDIVDECRILADNGVKELQLVAQCLTTYGVDLYNKKSLPQLVEKLADIKGIEWIRLHYAYPLGFPKDLLRVIRERDNVCNYLDIAFQHCNTRILSLMNRNMTKEALIDLIAEMRQEVPGIHLRTTVMTGHPGETEDEFLELYEFVENQKFERLGVFPYSHEEGSFCHKHYDDNVPEQTKRQRALKIMALQKDIYKQRNSELIGKDITVLIDSKDGDKRFVGRSEHSTPYADPKVIINSPKDLRIGEFYKIGIRETTGKDLIGEYLI